MTLLTWVQCYSALWQERRSESDHGGEVWKAGEEDPMTGGFRKMIAVREDEELLAIAGIRQCWLARDSTAPGSMMSLLPSRSGKEEEDALSEPQHQLCWLWYGRKLSCIHLRALHSRDAATAAESETNKEARASGSEMASVSGITVSWKEPSRGQLVAEGPR